MNSTISEGKDVVPGWGAISPSTILHAASGFEIDFSSNPAMPPYILRDPDGRVLTYAMYLGPLIAMAEHEAGLRSITGSFMPADFRPPAKDDDEKEFTDFLDGEAPADKTPYAPELTFSGKVKRVPNKQDWKRMIAEQNKERSSLITDNTPDMQTALLPEATTDIPQGVKDANDRELGTKLSRVDRMCNVFDGIALYVANYRAKKASVELDRLEGLIARTISRMLSRKGE